MTGRRRAWQTHAAAEERGGLSPKTEAVAIAPLRTQQQTEGGDGTQIEINVLDTIC